MSLAEPLKIAVRVGEALDRLGLQWVVVGALAASLHGIPRATQDVDLVTELTLDRVDALVDDLSAGFFVDRQAVVDAILHKAWFTVVHLGTMTRVDIFVVREERLSVDQIARRVFFRVYASEAILPVLSAEDAVLQALDWFRRSGRKAQRQWQDAVGVLRVCGRTLDRTLLRRAAKQARLYALLEKAWKEAGG